MAYAALSFLGSLLLFALEPFFGKALTPRFGGGAQVWVICLVFFQATLLAGYLYAHALIRLVHRRWQPIVHGASLGLVLVSMAYGWRMHGLPLFPGPGPVESAPLPALLWALVLNAGVPMAVLAATSPLLQAWHAERSGGDLGAYRLYAWSNAGSIGGLFAFPFLAEPFMRTSSQAWLLAALLVPYGAGMLAMARRHPALAPPPPDAKGDPGPGRPGVWILASAAGSLLLMAATNLLTMHIAVLPLLWILPLAVYLASYILLFDARWKLSQGVWPGVLMALFLAGSGILATGASMPAEAYVVATLAMTFGGCMVCHGLLFELRPAPSRLTTYYLCLSLGGVLGGLFVALLAPLLFDRFYEVGIAVLCVTLACAFLGFRGGRRGRAIMAALGAASLAVGALQVRKEAKGSGIYRRNFYGIVHMVRFGPIVIMDNLKTIHGFVDLSRPREATTYYTPDGGMDRALRVQMARHLQIDVGVVGLGVGSLATYGRAGDHYTFYEINPSVTDLAGPSALVLPMLRSSLAGVEVRGGDGRLSLEGEIRKGGSKPFDVLIVDAFSGDAVPWHLLTTEAFRAYLGRLAPDGILAIHVSNSMPVDKAALAQARELGLFGAFIYDPGNGRSGLQLLRHMSSSVLLMSRNEQALQDPVILKSSLLLFSPGAFRAHGASLVSMDKWRTWTDDRNDLSSLMFQDSLLSEIRRAAEAAQAKALRPLVP